MNIEDLLIWPERRSLSAVPEADALTDEDALLEAALVDIRIDAITSSVWMLFDLKGAIPIQAGNTAVVAVRGVTDLEWHADPGTGRTWSAVMSWRPAAVGGAFSVVARMIFGSSLRVSGAAAEFYVGDIPGGDDAPPDFTTATDREVRSGTAQWTSEFEVIHASFTDY